MTMHRAEVHVDAALAERLVAGQTGTVNADALHHAALVVPYWATPDPGFAALAGRAIREILAGDAA